MKIPAGEVTLDGDLTIPSRARGIVLFAHGSGSSRHSPRNRFVAQQLQASDLGTLLLDLLTPAEEELDATGARALRFDIGLLAERLLHATESISARAETRALPVGYFGASTGAAAALIAAAELGERIGAVVSRGGRPDLAGNYSSRVRAPTLLIIGGRDEVVIELNERAYARLSCPKQLHIVPGATHLFEEPGALETVAELAVQWFLDHLGTRRDRAQPFSG